MAKKRGIIKKAVIGLTVLASLVGIAYNAIPQVKEIVDNSVDKIVDSLRDSGIVEGQLVQLEAPTNIKFDERTGEITFDGPSNAKSYRVVVRHNDRGFEIDTFITSAQISESSIRRRMNGDKIVIEIEAIGDYITTKTSDAARYEYTLQHADEMTYKKIEDVLDAIFSDAFRVKTATTEIVGMNIVGNQFVFEGTGTSAGGRKINFTFDYNIQNYTGNKDITNPHDLYDLLVYMNLNIKGPPPKDEYAHEYIDLTQILEDGGAFDEYISQGYKIETLKYENSVLRVEDGNQYIVQKGLYKATHETKEDIIFQQQNKIVIENGKMYGSINEFVQDAKTQSVVKADSDEIVFDQTLTKHLSNLEKYAGNTQSIDDSFEMGQ